MNRFFLACLAVLLIAGSAEARPRSVHLMFDHDRPSCGPFCVELVSSDGHTARMTITLCRDDTSKVSGKCRRTMNVYYVGVTLTPGQIREIGQILKQGGYPTESDMRLFRYCRQAWFRTVPITANSNGDSFVAHTACPPRPRIVVRRKR
jgi:hypothetical protein